MRHLDHQNCSNEAKIQFLITQNNGMREDLEKYRHENDELRRLLNNHGTTTYKYQREIDELNYKDKNLRNEFDKTNLDYHKNLIDLRQKLSLDGAKNDKLQANYELMLKDRNDMINDLQ